MKKKIVGLALLAVGVAAIAFWLFHLHNRKKANEALEFFGNVDIREVNLGFRVSGKVAQVLRDEGDEVQAGEILAKLDDEPYRREADEARAQVAALRARCQLLDSGYRPQEVAQAKAMVHEREVTAANAERLYKRQEELLGSKAVSLQDRDDAQARFREADARLHSAQEQLALMEAGFRQEEIAQAKADLARAEAALASSELRLADTVMKAPARGVILTRAQEPGAVLQSGTTVLTLSLKEPVWVRAFLQEPDLGRIHPGMLVQVHTDSRQNPYQGQIGYVSPRAEFTPKNVETRELRTSLVYRTRIVIRDPDDGLRQGMPVTVTLVPR